MVQDGRPPQSHKVQASGHGGFDIGNIKKLSASYWGMLCAHIGIAVCAIGVGLSSVVVHPVSHKEIMQANVATQKGFIRWVN